MREYLPFVVIGLTTGSVYALAAMGLVVTYTTSGVFNFAHGAVGMIAAYAFYSLRVDAGLPTALAAAVSVLLVAPAIGVVLDRVLLRRLAGTPAAGYVVASLGLLVALQGVAIVVYGAPTRRVEPLFPDRTFRLPGVNVGLDQALVVLAAAAVGLALALFFRRTRLGLRTRAVVDDPDLATLMGTDARRITTFGWMMGSAFAALSGILLAPFLGLDAVLLTLLVVQAFGSAIVGRLRSLPLTYLGGLAIGVGAALSTKFVARYPPLAGLPTSLPFIVLFAVLVLTRKGAFVETKEQERPAPRRRRPRRHARFPWPTLVAGSAVAVALPAVLDGPQLLTATVTVAFVLVFSSLSLLVGLARLVSLSHAVFVVFGATTLAHLASAGVPYVPALVLAGLVMVPVGAIVAIPAIRLSGLFLALATFAFGVLAQDLLFPTGFAFGKDSIAFVPRPAAFRGDAAYYWFVLAVVTAGVVAVEAVRVTRLGRVLRAMADSPTGVESIGINPTVSRVLVFCLSAFLAGVAGGVLGSLTQLVNERSFDLFQSLVWVTVLVTAGALSLGGSVLAALLLHAVPALFTSGAVREYLPIFFGVAAVLLAQTPNGLTGYLRLPDFAALARRSEWRLHRSRSAERHAALRQAVP